MISLNFYILVFITSKLLPTSANQVYFYMFHRTKEPFGNGKCVTDKYPA